MTNEQAIKLLQHCGAEAHCRHFISTHNCDGCNMMTALNMAIEALSEPKTGTWKKISSAIICECSECGRMVMTGDIESYKFCHGCGARMMNGGEEE